MRQLRPMFAVIAIAALLVACSSTPSASSGDGGGGGGGASQPEASTGGGGASVSGGGGGGNGGGIFGDGSATYHITGDYTADGELFFVPAGSQMSQDSYQLSFTDDANSSSILVISLQGEARAFSFGDQGHTIPAASCEWDITRQEADAVAGTFSCNDQPLFTGDTGATGNVDISGEFDARK